MDDTVMTKKETNMRKILIQVLLLLAICSLAGAACGDQTSSGAPPSPAVFLTLGSSGVAGDQQYLYVMAGGMITQYEIAGMTIVGSTNLPDPALPTDAPPPPPPPAAGTGQLPPPPPQMPHGLWLGNNTLYALAGPFIYVYSLPGLSLQNTIQLTPPNLPLASQ